jgi:hypothetical protein
MPVPWFGFLAIPQPDPPVGDIAAQFAARAVAQDMARPVARAKPGHQAFHRNRLHRCLPLCRRAPPLYVARSPAAPLVRWNGKLRPLSPNPLGAMDVSNEHFLHVVQRPQKCRFLGEADFVDDHSARRLASQQAVGILADLSQNRFVFPRRIADKKRWNCCAQPSSITVVINANVPSSACASPRR